MKKYALAGSAVALAVLLIVVGITPVGVPDPLPADAPQTRFSAGRAMLLLQQVASEPRPIGSPRAADVRRLLVGRLRALRLEPHVQRSVVVSALNPRVAATVRNVVARLPGRDPSRTVLLVAHYDSVPVSAGAADDGMGVAAMLEVARALRAGPRPRNDVVFLLTDGEERGLLGARAFLQDHPWAYGVGVALNLEAAGSSTPALMYETSPDNGLLVGEFFASAAHPFASSLMYEVSRRQPIITDFRHFLSADVPGMSFASLDGPGHMHTGYDSLANVDPRTLQHLGDTALAAARRLGELDLWDLHRPDAVYFDVVGATGVVYPGRLVLPSAALGVAVFVAAVAVAAHRRLLTARGVAASLLASAATLGAAVALLIVVWGMYRTAYEERVWTETGIVINDLYRLGLVLLAAAAILGCYGIALRRLRVWDLAVAALSYWAAASVLVALTVPGASYLLTWPLVAAGLGLIGVSWLGDRVAWTARGVVLTMVAAAPGVVLMSSATYLLLLSAGLKQVVTVLAVWFTAGLLVVPMAAVWRAFRLWLPAAMVLAGAIVLFSVGSAVAYDSEHPKFSSVYYRVEPGRQPVWQIIDPADAWTRQFLADQPGAPFLASYFPQLGSEHTLTGAAPRAGLPPPRITVLSDTVVGDRRTVRLHLVSRRRAQVVSLLVHSVVGKLTAAVEGQVLQGADTTILDSTTVRWAFDYYALPARGIDVELSFQAGPSVLISVVDFSYGVPPQLAGTFRPRPAGMLAGRIGDGALLESRVRLPAVPAAGTADGARVDGR